jgi:uncharacterized Zn ribbon protein
LLDLKRSSRFLTPNLIRRQRGKVLHEHTVDEDVAATDTAQEDAVGAVLEKGDNVP